MQIINQLVKKNQHIIINSNQRCRIVSNIDLSSDNKHHTDFYRVNSQNMTHELTYS